MYICSKVVGACSLEGQGQFVDQLDQIVANTNHKPEPAEQSEKEAMRNAYRYRMHTYEVTDPIISSCSLKKRIYRGPKASYSEG